MSYFSLVTDLPGQIGDKPRRPKLITSATYSQVTTAGFINSSNLEGQTIYNTDVFDVWYGAVTAGPSGSIVSPGTYAVFTPSISNGVITLVEWANPGDVLLPVTSGDFAVFNGTSGQIKDAGYSPTNSAKTKVVMANGAVTVSHMAVYEDTAGTIGQDATTAINGGNIQAGLSGTAGTVASFPATASKGSLVLAAVANTGNTTTTISNDAMAQASVVNIPDPGNATGQFMVGATATPFVSGNFPQASGTAGLMTSGLPPSATGQSYVVVSPGSLTSGDIAKFNDANGTLADSGIAASNVMSLAATNTMASTGSIVLHKTNGTEASNAVTASGNSGVITTSSLTVSGGSTYVITWTNTKISSTSVIGLTWMGGTNTNANFTMSATAGSGTSTLTIYNNAAATSISGTIFIGYTVF